MQSIKTLDLRSHINSAIPLLKFHSPYDEEDQVFNSALDLLARGTCLDHLEIHRTDEAYLNAVGSQRIPDTPTAGDFCRSCSSNEILGQMLAFDLVRQSAWKLQPAEFLGRAVIEVDGSTVETSGQRQQGIRINYEKRWGHHPLIVTLANTQEVLFIHNRSGDRPRHERSAFFFDESIEMHREAGFQEIVL